MLPKYLSVTDTQTIMDDVSLNPGLFGSNGRSNRDFSKNSSWGKNQFNNSFPIALICYANEMGIRPLYLKLDRDLNIDRDEIEVVDLFGKDPKSEDLFFSFDSDYPNYRTLIKGRLPRIDLVTMEKNQKSCLRCLEIKLTALPDNQTHHLSESEYGCEIVVRPDTIAYLALTIAEQFSSPSDRQELLAYVRESCEDIRDWSKKEHLISKLDRMYDAINGLLSENLDRQQPLVIQPIWKTEGKSFKLRPFCLDVFVWSNFAFTRLFFDAAKDNIRKLKARKTEVITRFTRSIIWLTRMLYHFGEYGYLPEQSIFKSLSYCSQSDKAFALGGLRTNPYMKCDELIRPRIPKTELKNIILGGGQLFLSPERRFDAAILNNLDLFS